MPQDFLYGGGLHPVDLLRWFMGDITEVSAYSQKSNRSPEYPIEDNFMLLLKFATGCIGTVSVLCGVFHPPVPIIQVDLFGSKGSVVATYTEGEPGFLKLVTERLTNAPVQEIHYEAETGITYKHGESERNIFKYFASCVINNSEPDPNAIEGAKGVAVAAAAWDSIRSGVPVKVKQDF